MMDTRRLLHFAVVAKHRNLHTAASELAISQPALSRSIQTLEREVGASLFTRSNKGMFPNHLGNILLGHAAKVLDNLDGAMREIQLLSGLKSGQLIIGVAPIIPDALVQQAVLTFSRQYPGISLRLETGTFQTLNNSLREESIDFYVGDTEQAGRDPTVEVIPFPTETLHIVGGPTHPLAERASVDPVELVPYAMVGPNAPDRFLAWFRKNIHKGHPAADTRLRQIECDRYAIIFRLIQQSDYITIASPSTIAEHSPTTPLTILNVEGADQLTSMTGIVKRQGSSLPPAAEQFEQILVHAAQNL